MADESPHKKFHDITEKFVKIDEGKEPHARDMYATMLKTGLAYYDNNKSIDNIVKWDDDKAKLSFADMMWDTMANHVAKHYLKYDDATIANMKKPDIDGNSNWDQFIGGKIGIYRKQFRDLVLNDKEFDPITFVQKYVQPLIQYHQRTRKEILLSEKIKEQEDAQGLLNYLKHTKSKNPKELESLGDDSLKYKGLDETRGVFREIYKQIPKDYKPT
jgi:hypothetical protein